MQSRPGASHVPGRRFNKACDSCHVSKVRCVLDPQSPVGTCRRCSKNGTQCIYSPLGPRRRPARTKNDRIAELERRVRDMQLKLEKGVEERAGKAHPRHDASESAKKDPASSGRIPGSRPTSAAGSISGSVSGSDSGSSPISHPVRAVAETHVVDASAADAKAVVERPGVNVTGWNASSSSPSGLSVPTLAPGPQPGPARDLDVIDRGLVTESQADQLVQEFRTGLDGKCLGICLPDGFTNSQLRRAKPAFWLSVLCAASSGSTDLLFLAPLLFGELKTMTDGSIMPGAKPDLDALQAFMNYVVFHNDPVLPMGSQLLSGFGAAMKMLVQMAEDTDMYQLSSSSSIPEERITEDIIQLSRELLRWYWVSFSLSVKSRQSTMLRHTHLVEASMQILKTTQKYNDACLIEWAKLVQIEADAVLALYRGHTQSTTGLDDEARDSIIDDLERKRRTWLVECPFDLVSEPLMLEYHYYVLLVSEVIYPAGPADFNRRSHSLPSLSATGPNTDPIPDQNFFAPYKIRYTHKCITAAHACLDLATQPAENKYFDQCNSEDLLRHFGVFPYGRIFYALRFLLFITHEVWRTGRFDIVDIKALKLEEYISRLKRGLKHASCEGIYRVPNLWLYALETRIEPWYRRLYVLLQRYRPQSVQPSNHAGSEPPNPKSVSNMVASSGQSATAPEGQDRDSSTGNGLTARDMPLSPLVFDFPFELLSSDMSATSHFNITMGLNDNLKRDGEACTFTSDGRKQASAPQCATTQPTHASIAPLPDNSMAYQPRQVAASEKADARESTSQNGDAGGLSTLFSNPDMNMDSFMFTWNYSSVILPESELQPLPLPPDLFAETAYAQGNASSGMNNDDGREP